MRRFRLTSFLSAALLLFYAAGSARAQDAGPHWEVGGHVSAFDVGDGEGSVQEFVCPVSFAPCVMRTTNADHRATEFGFGARVGYRLDRHFTVEAEGSFFPRERALTDNDHFTGGRKTQVLFGAKVGRSYERFGFFVKARPGYVHFSAGDLRLAGVCVALFPPPLSCFERRGRADFAFDLGGVLELYPSARTLVRVDAGDTLMLTRAHNVPVTTTVSTTVVEVPARTTHNFQGSVGFGFRF
ncbi:MAG TPA: outer membrane beta-barrel protein [Pyrinomonadaceae bacterium]|nr:outer membrane beta-barrel protein [Pyrinomonadaceae bacterium]